VDRVERAVKEICDLHPDGHVIAAAHFGVIVSQIQMAQQITAYEAFANKIQNFSVTRIEYETTRNAQIINHLP